MDFLFLLSELSRVQSRQYGKSNTCQPGSQSANDIPPLSDSCENNHDTENQTESSKNAVKAQTGGEVIAGGDAEADLHDSTVDSDMPGQFQWKGKLFYLLHQNAKN